MNSFITEYSKLPVLHCHINQHRIAIICLLHFKLKKKFSSTIDGIHITAFAFHKNTNLSACHTLSIMYSLDNKLLLFSSEEIFSF